MRCMRTLVGAREGSFAILVALSFALSQNPFLQHSLDIIRGESFVVLSLSFYHSTYRTGGET